MRIMYVEDNADDADLTCRALAKAFADLQIDVLHTAQAALSHMLKTPRPAYDVILTDLRLPDGDGLQILSAVQRHDLRIPVVIVTSSGNEDAVIAALKGGAADYVAKKPGYLTHLPAILQDVLTRHRQAMGRRQRPFRVLYGEHNLADIELTKRFLALHAPHIRIEAVLTAQEVLDQASSSSPPDLLLLDYHLPGMSALDLLKELRQIRQVDIPIVVVTGRSDEESALQCLKLGAFDFLIKRPGYLDRLPSILENAYAQRELERQHQQLRASQEAERRQRILAEALQAALAALVSTTDLDTVLDQILVQLRRVLPYEAATVMLIEGDVARVVRSQGYEERGLSSVLGLTFPVDQFDNLRRMRDTGQAVIISETRNYPDWRRDPETAWIMSYAGAPLRAHGRVVGFLNLDAATPGYFTEATAPVLQAFADQASIAIQNAQLYATLQATNAELREALKAKDEMIQNVSHELRTPLTLLKGYTELLETGALGPLTPEQEEALRIMHAQGDRLHFMVDRLLRLQSIQRSALQLTPLDVGAWLRAIVRSWEARAAAAGISLKLDLDPELPEIQADADFLEQVVVNLLDNAVKFSPHGGTITVNARHGAMNGHKAVTISVADEGIGIPKDKLSRLFDRFFQVESGLTRRFGGIGIGLALCKAIVEVHGGEIWAESPGPGQGSTFYVRLPA